LHVLLQQRDGLFVAARHSSVHDRLTVDISATIITHQDEQRSKNANATVLSSAVQGRILFVVQGLHWAAPVDEQRDNALQVGHYVRCACRPSIASRKMQARRIVVRFGTDVSSFLQQFAHHREMSAFYCMVQGRPLSVIVFKCYQVWVLCKAFSRSVRVTALACGEKPLNQLGFSVGIGRHIGHLIVAIAIALRHLRKGRIARGLV
jgi:hypothetical protein